MLKYTLLGLYYGEIKFGYSLSNYIYIFFLSLCHMPENNLQLFLAIIR